MKPYLIRHAQSANNLRCNASDHVEGPTPGPGITETLHAQGEPQPQAFVSRPGNGLDLTHLNCRLMTP